VPDRRKGRPDEHQPQQVILSALDGQTRNPNTKDAARRAIGRHAERLGVGVDDLLAAAAGLLDGRVSADDFRAQLREESAGESLDGADEAAGPDAGRTDEDSPAAAKTPSEANDDDGGEPSFIDRPVAAESPQSSATGARAPTVRQQLLAACQAAEHWLQAELDRPDDILRVLRSAIARADGQPRPAHESRRQRPPRQGSKEAQVIALLRRPEGATLAQIGESTGWQAHTIRGFFAAALKKRHGLAVTSEKPEGGARTYRLAE
jgi:Protein of unknown function (DUF3489)